MHDSDSLKDYPQVRQLAIRSLFEIIEQSSEGTVIVDRQARIVWMNERYARRFGLADAASAIGQPCEAVIPGSLMREVVNNGRPILLDMLDTPNEPLVVMRLPIHDDQGALIGAIGFALFDELRSLSPLLKRYSSMQQELASTRSQLRARQAKYSFAQFVGSSAASLEAKRRARRGASSDSPVLLLGETGTGKELLARQIHRASDRSGLFVSVNCAAISPTYADAELFGYSAGSQGGTASSRAGWFGSANGGTLYLDEIADLPLAIQGKLLAALENREVTRVGAQQPQPVDVRLVAATSIDLARVVRAGRFNERLYQYLREGALELPPLRERPGDILPLAEYFVGIYSVRLQRPVPLVSEAAQQALEAHPWPGNTRELENVIHFALLLNDGEEILAEDLDLPDPAR